MKEIKLKNMELLGVFIKKLAKKKPDIVKIRTCFYNFGRVKYERDKCIACLNCYENCPTKAYSTVRIFDLKSIKEADYSKLYWKRKIIYELILEIAQKELSGIVEVPEGLPGYGSVEHNEEKCISCKKCVDLCPTGALSFDHEINMRRFLGGE